MARLPHILILGFIWLGFQSTAYAQEQDSLLEDPSFQAMATTGLDYLYNMQFEQADAIFTALARAYPEHPMGPFLQALVPWWQILMDLPDESNDQAFFDSMDEVISRADRILRRDRGNLDARFFKGAALGMRGRHRANRRNYFTAARDGLRAMDYVIGVANDNPSNPDFEFGKGIYDYYAAAAPERFPWSRPFVALFPSGSKARGLAALHRTFRDGTYLQAESAYFLLQIYYLFERDYIKSRQFIGWLRTEYPANAIFHVMEGRIEWRFGHWDSSESIFREVLRQVNRRTHGYNDSAHEQALYYLAMLEARKNNDPAALVFSEQLERLAPRRPEGSAFVILGRLRHGMTLDRMGRRAEAEQRYREVLQMRNTSNAHDRARRYLQTPYGR